MKTARDNEARPGRRRARGDKRARTRAALLEAARTLVREKGYEHTTLDDVARRAGMTTGAIYGNFRSRADLFVALGETYWVPVTPRLEPDPTFADVMRAMAGAALAAVSEREPAAIGRLTGLAHTLTNDELRARVHDITRHHYALGAQWLLDLVDEHELPMPAERLVPVIHAMTEGLVLQRILTPALVPDEVFYAAFDALARAGSVSSTPAPASRSRTPCGASTGAPPSRRRGSPRQQRPTRRRD